MSNPDIIPLHRAQIRWNIGGPVTVLDQADCATGIYRNCTLQRSDGACCAEWEERATLKDLLDLAWQLAIRDRVPVSEIHAEFQRICEYAEYRQLVPAITTNQPQP